MQQNTKHPNKTALFIGATGLTGKLLLSYLLQDNTYQQIILLQRKKPTCHDPRIKWLKLDIETLNENSLAKQTIDDFISCFGCTKKQFKSKEQFEKTEYKVLVTSAKIAKKAQATRMFMISSIGAKASSINSYLKTKGRIEKKLLALNFRSTIIFKPSLITGNRNESRFLENVSHLFFKVFMANKWPLVFQNYTPISAKEIAKKMCYLVKQEHTNGRIVLHNKDIRN